MNCEVASVNDNHAKNIAQLQDFKKCNNSSTNFSAEFHLLRRNKLIQLLAWVNRKLQANVENQLIAKFIIHPVQYLLIAFCKHVHVFGVRTSLAPCVRT